VAWIELQGSQRFAGIRLHYSDGGLLRFEVISAECNGLAVGSNIVAGWYYGEPGRKSPRLAAGVNALPLRLLGGSRCSKSRSARVKDVKSRRDVELSVANWVIFARG
jgi:hypothetical protein